MSFFLIIISRFSFCVLSLYCRPNLNNAIKMIIVVISLVLLGKFVVYLVESSSFIFSELYAEWNDNAGEMPCPRNPQRTVWPTLTDIDVG